MRKRCGSTGFRTSTRPFGSFIIPSFTLLTFRSEMKAFSPRITRGTGAAAATEPQKVTSTTRAHPATTYASLLEGPMALLAGDVMDRPEVQSAAILGYN